MGENTNVDRTKYMVMSRDQNVGRIHNMKIDNNALERVQQFEYLGKFLKNQNSILKEINNRLQSRNACYHSVQNLLSSSKLSKNKNA
jgi:predicted RNA-binding protein with EMAP domain